jgi:hypothetical protein
MLTDRLVKERQEKEFIKEKNRMQITSTRLQVADLKTKLHQSKHDTSCVCCEKSDFSRSRIGTGQSIDYSLFSQR